MGSSGDVPEKTVWLTSITVPEATKSLMNLGTARWNHGMMIVVHGMTPCKIGDASITQIVVATFLAVPNPGRCCCSGRSVATTFITKPFSSKLEVNNGGISHKEKVCVERNFGQYK